MNSDFLDSVKEIFENPEKMDPAQVQRLIAETNQYFSSLEEVFQSDNPKAKEEAVKAATELKEFLESKIHTFSPLFGQEPSEEEQAMIAEFNDGIKIKP